MDVTAHDDRDRPAIGTDIIDLEWVDPGQGIAGLLRVEVRPTAGATRFLAAVVRTGEDPVVVLDHDLPVVTDRFEFRAPAVWVELTCEEALEHWTVGLEAFGLGIDAGEPVGPDTFGDRVPLGLDLDLETVGAAAGVSDSFAVDVAVRGEVLVGTAAHEVDAIGIRRRRCDGLRLGRRPSAATVVAGELAVRWPERDGPPTVERRGWTGGRSPGWFWLPTQEWE